MSVAQRIGLISDTHDLLRPEAIQALDGVTEILHMGDVCRPSLLDELRAIAPTRVVRGNCDSGRAAESWPWSDTYAFGSLYVHAIHIIEQLDLDPSAAGISIVCHGHSHRPGRKDRGGVVFFNPGSAGPHRFDLPATLGFLDIGPELRDEPSGHEGWALSWWDLDESRPYSP